MRSHLTRLTSELASHRDLLVELRNLRDSDSRALKEKGADIMKLREEVQRLAGEVEVLRGVVEEGLKERRASREIQVEHSVADVAMSRDLEDEEEQEEGNKDVEVLRGVVEEGLIEMRASREVHVEHSVAHVAMSQELEEEEQEEGSGDEDVPDGDDSEEILSDEEDPRRLEAEDDYEGLQPSNIPNHSQSRLQTTLQPEPSSSRPSAPAADYVPKQAGPARFQEHLPGVPETPFPQIRGEHLERLFFSAPEHNAKTCTVCYRRRHRTGSSFWSYPRKNDHARNANVEPEEDEGFGEGSDEAADVERAPRDSKGKQRDYVIFSKDPGYWRQAGRKEGLPPQTVVARVIRELEDDFTHYKRLVCWVMKKICCWLIGRHYSVYVELADQYKVMDAVSDVPRRNMLARHLREVVDILEQKVSLYSSNIFIIRG